MAIANKLKSKSKSKNHLPLLIALAAIIFVGLPVATYYVNRKPDPVVTARLNRIEAIYDSLHLGSEYTLVSSTVLGDKRVYSYDKSRTYSSTKIYERNEIPEVVSADLTKTITQMGMGFEFLDEPYPGAAFKEEHFKNAKGEYIRVNVESKAHKTSIQGNPDAAPSVVQIKVNLDDNNE